jgi:hypothetical protein
VRVARRVREGTCGRRPVATPAPRPQVYLTHDQVGRSAVTRKSEFYTLIERALERLRALPDVVRRFFRDPALAYINAR